MNDTPHIAQRKICLLHMVASALTLAFGMPAMAQHVHQQVFAAEAPVSAVSESGAQSFAALMGESMRVMDAGMNQAPMNGNPDHDFAAMMIPHHQGAIDMAKAELLFGKNPVLRRLAQEIIVTQESEIALMRTELSKPSSASAASASSSR